MSKFYAVAHGFKRGLFEDWNEAKKQIDDFPQAVYKKFDDKKEAEKYLNERKATSTKIVPEDTKASTFYAVARGKTIGVFVEYDEVKKSIADYPQALQKKFSTFAEAHEYYLKFAEGKGAVKEESKKSKETKSAETSNAEVFYAVARGHKSGVFSTWAECKEQTDGFRGAKFKKFDNKEEAELFASGKTLKQIEEHKKRSNDSSSNDTDCPVPSKKSKKV
ncbi:unnamed protein product, partial [Mesorhabditis belari]|uniref:Ribonuclease H n=1 Tax=Mesorhabditis belari TaxID=2138241 RepID=A0AAF3EHC8_9BILA